MSDLSDERQADRWLTSAEAAAYMGVKPSTLAKRRQRGLPPRFSAAFGKDPRYRRSLIDKFMMSFMTGNTTEARTLRQHLRSSLDGDGGQ